MGDSKNEGGDRRESGGETSPMRVGGEFYEELRRLARRHVGNEPRRDRGATSLLHDAFVRLSGGGSAPWENEGHFYGAAATAMRRILVEQARARGSQKRGGGRERCGLTSLHEDPRGTTDIVDYIELDAALDELERRDQQAAEVVMLRYFAGLTIERAARVLEVSERTVKKQWQWARAWLHQRLTPLEGHDG